MGTFFDELDQLHAGSRVVIDRPAGSTHPRFPSARYPIDYGYLEGTTGGDGEGVDVFVGSAAGAGVVAAAGTVDPGRRDAAIKILADCSTAEVEAVTGFLADVLVSACTSSCTMTGDPKASTSHVMRHSPDPSAQVACKTCVGPPRTYSSDWERHNVAVFNRSVVMEG